MKKWNRSHMYSENKLVFFKTEHCTRINYPSLEPLRKGGGTLIATEYISFFRSENVIYAKKSLYLMTPLSYLL